MPELIAILSTGKQVRLTAEQVSPGVYALKTTATLSGSVTIGEVDIGLVDRDGKLGTLLTDATADHLTIDRNGRLWIAGMNVADAIINAEDVVVSYAYTGDDLTKVTYVSALWRTYSGQPTLRVEEVLAYGSGKLSSVTRSVLAT
jgi:hypothetical protein